MRAAISFKGICGPYHTGGLCCYGYVVSTAEGDIYKGKGVIGRATENAAEYIALIEGLRKALDSGVTKASIFGDSELVIKQIIGRWHTDTKLLQNLSSVVDDLLSKFEESRLTFVEPVRVAEALRLARASYNDILSLTDAKRIKRAREIVAAGLVTRLTESKFKVKTYDVDLAEQICNCGDNEKGHHKCKHMIAAEIYLALQGEVNIPGEWTYPGITSSPDDIKKLLSIPTRHGGQSASASKSDDTGLAGNEFFLPPFIS